MPLVGSVDYPNKRIYLSVETVGVSVQPVEVYKEVRALRLANEGDRGFSPLITARGNEPAGPTNTQIITILAAGARIVPYDVSHSLLVGGVLVNLDDGLAGSVLFDRSPLSPGVIVDVEYQPPQVEVIEVPASVLTTEQAAKLDELWRMRGLDAANPVTVTQTDEVAGDISLDITGDGENTSTLTRQL